jgi:hypothetical protein
MIRSNESSSTVQQIPHHGETNAIATLTLAGTSPVIVPMLREARA